jgi:glycosyltransferase involved in cell wall biosynthesis
MGLEKAKGKYVTFIDSDDYVSRDYLSTLYELEKRFQVGLSACRVEKVFSSKSVETVTINVEPRLLEGKELFHRFFKYEFWGLYGKLYLRSLLLDIVFPKATISEDYFVTAQLLQKVGKMAYKDCPLYYYEHHESSLSHQVISNRSFEEFQNVKGVYDYTALKMPEYKSFALSNAVESAVKLLLASKKQTSLYGIQRRDITEFMSRHRKEIMACRPLNPKTAFLSLILSLHI